MAIRQEQVALVGAVVVLVAFVATNDSKRKRNLPRVSSLELADHVVPDSSRVLPGALEASFTRDIMSEPTNARPMPLLDFLQPPLSPLPSLAAHPCDTPAPHDQIVRHSPLPPPSLATLLGLRASVWSATPAPSSCP